MMTLLLSLSSYVLLFILIAKLPEGVWDKILKLYDRYVIVIQLRLKGLPLLGEIYRGEELLLALAECESRLTLGIKILSGNLPEYKFYTNLLDHLFESHRRLGTGIKKFIPEIRLALIHDIRFEKKVVDEILSGLMQFLVIAATTWSFVFLSKLLVSIPLDSFTALFMIFLEVFGFIIFLFLIKSLKVKAFGPFSRAIEELYLFSALMDTGLAINEVMAKSQILTGSFSSHKNFKNLSHRLNKLVSRMKETGLSPKEEVHEIIREIWHLQDTQFAKFTKMVQIFKFSILAFFYLPAYFLYLHSIFKFFMEQ